MGDDEHIDDFLVRFKKAHILLEWDESALSRNFIRSLTPILKEDMLLNQSSDTDLDELYERARLKYMISRATCERNCGTDSVVNSSVPKEAPNERWSVERSNCNTIICDKRPVQGPTGKRKPPSSPSSTVSIHPAVRRFKKKENRKGYEERLRRRQMKQ